MSISAVASKGSSSSSSASSSKPMDFVACANRIQELVKMLNLNINNKKLERFCCPITWEVPQDLVVTNCGHIFERLRILEVKDEKKQPCPVCRVDIVAISPVHELKQMIEEQQKQEAIPILVCKNENRQLAYIYLATAQICIEEKRYEEALTTLSLAFLHTKASENYAKLPFIYEQLKDGGKATLAYLHLALYQLEEGKITEAIKTLDYCKKLNPGLEIEPILKALTRMAQVIQDVPKQGSEEAIAIYKQVIAYSPRALTAYDALIPLLQDPKEKEHYLSKAAECATQSGKSELEKEFTELIADIQIAEMHTSITLREWAKPQLLLDELKQTSRFKRLEKFLSGPCPIWKGKIARETHGFAFRFKNFIITENGSSVEVPRTLANLDRCDKASQGPGCRYISDEALNLDHKKAEEEEFELIVFTKDVLPESRKKDYAFQKQLVESKGYEVPSVIDAATYILWENRLSGNRLFSNTPLWTFTRCRDVAKNGLQLIVGGFTGKGLYVGIDSFDDEFIGIAGVLKF